MRVVYLQYASDPVTFFEYRSFYREPDWMLPPRGPDVSPQLRWYPVVTLLQLALDMLMATTAPIGHGHVYAPAHYIDAWMQATDVRRRPRQDIMRLKQPPPNPWPASSVPSPSHGGGGLLSAAVPRGPIAITEPLSPCFARPSGAPIRSGHHFGRYISTV